MLINFQRVKWEAAWPISATDRHGGAMLVRKCNLLIRPSAAPESR